jgi:hypothetical protein
MMLQRKLLAFILGLAPFVFAQPEQPPLRRRGMYTRHFETSLNELTPIASLSFSNRTTSSILPSTRTPVTLSSVPSSTSPTDPIKLSKNPGRNAPCCFVVQDTVTEQWWDQFSTSSTYGLVNVTSITTYVTRGSDGLGTIIGSNSSVTLTNTSFMFSYNVGVNPLATLFNAAPGPTEIDNRFTGTETTTGGEVVYVYPKPEYSNTNSTSD